ncbi:MAG: nucleotidyltransferase domain-containing protein [Chloroflexi bacterium]|nr:MAG: nucleotidyltransferase domain-containing protein [Chloroflexota bacterium]
MATDQAHIARITAALANIRGITCVVLGGSRAVGGATTTSDIDIGVYYEPDILDLHALNQAVTALDDTHRVDLLASPGAWGNWVNGGAWLHMDGTAVDILLRDRTRVLQACIEAQQGTLHAHYQPGHPHAFMNVMYAGELAVCRVLWSDDETLVTQKMALQKYPVALQNAMIAFFGFEAAFSAGLAEKYAKSGDTYYVRAHIMRSIGALNQVLCGLNRQYCINEKRATARIAMYPIRPLDYKKRVDALVCCPRDTDACAALSTLIREVSELCDAHTGSLAVV